MAVLLQLPFNGNSTGTGTTPANASVSGGQYVAGRISNMAVSFAGVGKAEIVPKLVPLNGIYTLSFWVKIREQPDGPTASWLLYKFNQPDRFLYLDFGSPLTRWSYIVIIQDATSVSAYLNGRKADGQTIPAGWGKPTGFCLVNDGTATSGYATMEEVTIYDTILSQISPSIPTPLPNLVVAYSVNGVSFRSLGITVSQSEGLIENPALKDPLTFEWPDYHGEIIDLSRPRYQPRQITLSCFILAYEGVDDFLEKINSLLSQFRKPGTQRLRVLAHSSKPFVYEVYLPESINLKKKWNAGEMVGTFELQLVEPEPVKRVLSFDTGTASITLTSQKVVSISWGDQTRTDDVFGTAVTVTHTYSTPGPHEIVMAGVIEDITNFSTNATVLWARL